MNDFKTRLEVARTDLLIKMQKLNDFLGSEKCSNLDVDQKTLLNIQTKAMDTYLQCLEARITRF